MDANFTQAVQALAERLFGEPTALDTTDAVLVTQILDFVNSRPALGKSDRIAISAIVQLSGFEPALARTLAAQLAE